MFMTRSCQAKKIFSATSIYVYWIPENRLSIGNLWKRNCIACYRRKILEFYFENLFCIFLIIEFLAITILYFPNSITIRSARELGFVSLDTQDIGLQLIRAKILNIFYILSRVSNISRSVPQKIVLCNIRVNKKYSRRKIKNRALVSCSPMSCVSNETNPSSLALRIAMEFGKRQPLHFDR